MSKSRIKTIFLIFGIVTWIFLFFSNWLWFEAVRSPFTTKVYDVSRRLTSPRSEKTALLVRDYAFDMNFRLFVVEDSNYPAPKDFRDALWSSPDYHTNTSINWHEDIEWSNDSSIIAVIIEDEYVFAYDFDLKKEYKDAGEIKRLLETHKTP